MGNLMLAELTAPKGLWSIIINWIQSSVGNFAWTIILFTLFIKVCLSPLDFFIKWSTKKSTLVQQKCAPQIAKLQKKYGGNTQAVQIQTQALYKREGFNVTSSCLVMLVNLVVTLLVFLSIFTALKEVSAYQAIKQYQSLENAYQTTYTQVYSEKLNSELAIKISGYDPTFTYTDPAALAIIEEEKASADTYAKSSTEVKNAVNATWKDCKENWLWISNIWVADSSANPMPTYKALNTLATSAKGLFGSKVNNEYVNAVKDINETEYNTIASIVQAGEARWNGYFILAIGAGLSTFLSTYIAELSNKLKRGKKEKVVAPKKNQFIKDNNPAPSTATQPSQAGTMKFMKILMPAMMVIFVLSSSSAFGLYVVTQSIVGIGLSALINLIVDKLTYKKQIEVIEYLNKMEKK